MPAAIAIPFLISAGAGVAQSVIAARASGKAADQQTAAGNQALSLQRDVLNQQQQNIAPFLQVGAGGLGRLNEMMGRQGQSLSGVGMGGGDPTFMDPNGPVRVKAPNGRIVLVPHERLKEAIQNGGVPVDQGFQSMNATPGVTQVPITQPKAKRPTYREYLAQKPKAQTGLGSL